MKLFELIFSRALERRVAAFQDDLLQRHVEEVQNIYKTMRGWRHDYHNHIQTMLALEADGQREQLKKYLLGLNDDLTQVDTVVKTGNVMVDAILNSKLSLIKSHGIATNVKAALPGALNVNDVDMCVALGNLLDNALEACLRQTEGERFIRVYIGVLKQQLYISVTNSSGTICRSGRSYCSTKATSEHGLGLYRIDRIAAKYNGSVNRQSEEGVFATELLLPL
ncbi:MAG: GHKL domain-containing protein [Clostridia bacterium]|nr:GHKL domain-containing protein [Clostridia bacterium]